jgi:LmbE family N-acetylglucosaminyl deacetylase
MNIRAKRVGNWVVGVSCLLACRAPGRGYDWQPLPDKIALLAVWAHPDDEGIFGGGSLPYYSAVLNVPTMLVCMTAGWGTVRDDELRCAAWNYGLRYAPVFGRFADINSGAVPNNPYTNSIDMTWDYWAGVGFRGDGSDVEAGKARAINFVAEQIRRYRPDVIITHDLNGETGHDNHKATAYAVTQAFVIAADPNATAPNLVGLPPWQVQKLYVHLYGTNRLFHEFWETPYPALTNRTPHQAANLGLTCHVSQGPLRWIGASVYPPGGIYNTWPSEWWGLYASMVGPDTVLSSNIVANGYAVPAGVAAEDFLENLPIYELYFTAVPRSAIVRAGASITLSAMAATTGSPLGYQWQFNGSGIEGATAASLVLSNVQSADAGSYTVVVTNTASSITSAVAVLTVLVPPVIMAFPQTRTNFAGTAATFSATASGSGPLSYQWLLNGVSLRDNGNILGATAGTLHIFNMQPTNAGNLVLAVSSPGGVAAATVATLVVEVPPPCLPAPPDLVGWWRGEGNGDDLAGTNNGAWLGGATASTLGEIGQAFSFHGTNDFVQIPDAPELNPTNLTIEAWVLFSSLDSDGSGASPPGQQYIVFKQNSGGTTSAGYQLGKARTADGDVFSFVVSSVTDEVCSLCSTTLVTTSVWYHVAGVRDSNFTRLYVNGQLECETNVAFPQDYGTNALFFGSSGDPFWDYKFTGLLDEVSLYSRALTADEINAIYNAGAAGKCLEAAFTTQPESQTVLVGSKVTFTVAAWGPALSYQWLFNDTNVLAGGTYSTLSLTNLSLSQSGNYSVIASNFAGAVFSQTATLTVAPIRGIVMPINLSGDVGSSWRIDYLNDLGSTNGWVTLATVTLTNTSQIYSDTTALSQAHRFYRVVQLP